MTHSISKHKLNKGEIGYRICTCRCCPGIHRARVLELRDHGQSWSYRIELLDPAGDDPAYVIPVSGALVRDQHSLMTGMWFTAQDALAYAVKCYIPHHIDMHRRALNSQEDWLKLVQEQFSDEINKGVADVFAGNADLLELYEDV